VKTSVGMGDAYVVRLRPVDGIAQDPAAVSAMGVHPFSAEVAFQAGSDARDDHLVSHVKFRDARPDLLIERAIMARPTALRLLPIAHIYNRRKANV